MSFRDPTIPSTLRGDRRRGLIYPSPFFDVAQSYMPPTVKELLKWCAYFFYTDPLLGSVIYKIAEYPITDFIYNSEDSHVRDKWKEVLEETLNIKPFLIEIGLDFFTFGNAFISINLPFRRLLRCSEPDCASMVDANDVKYKFKQWKFHYTCPHCKEEVVGEVVDTPIKSAHEVNFIRWDPKNIEIEYNPLSGKSRYRYRVPNRVRRAIINGKPEMLNDIPWIFIKAVKEGKDVILSQKNLFHFKRPTLAEQDQGWGKPLILHSMKRLFYLYVLRRAQEAIALQRILPLEFIFPQANATQDPYCVSLSTLIECRDGIKPAGEVKSGDYIKSHLGNWKRVEGAVDRSVSSEEKVYRFTVSGISAFPFEISEEHPIWASKRPKRFRGFDSLEEPEWVFAKDVKVGDYVCYPSRRRTWSSMFIDLKDHCPERVATDRYIYRRLNQESAEIYEYLEEHGQYQNDRSALIKSKGWDEKNYANARAAYSNGGIDRRPRHLDVTKEMAYLIGVYAAEGSPNGSLASIGLHSNETSIKDQLDKAIRSLGFHEGTWTTNGNSARYSINDVFLASFLTDVCGKGAQSKHLPRFITEAPKDIAVSAVRGVWDGDGCAFETDTVRAGLKTTSPQLAMDVRMILISEGILPAVTKAAPREDEISKLPYYQVNCNGPNKDALSKLFSGESFSTRSRVGFIRDGFVYLRVSSVDSAPDVEVVRGFQVEGDRSFCVAGVATHNSHVNLHTWSGRIQDEIQKWKGDPNYISVVPVPLGFERLGGDGRALLLGPEIEIANKEITGGMGVPIEFVFGGLSWSGSSVSLRTLENHFLMYRRLLMRFLDFVKGHLVTHLGLPGIELKFTEFKMADDIQRKQLVMQLNAAQKISTKTLLTELGFDYEREMETIRKEIDTQMELQERQMKAQAKAQGEAQVTSVKYQAQAQEAQIKADQQLREQMGEQMPPEEEGQPEEGQEQDPAEGQQQEPPPGAEREVAQQAAVQGMQPSPGEESKAGGGTQAGGVQGGNVVPFDVDSIAKRWATKIMQMPVGQQSSVLADIQARMPNMYQVLLSFMGMTPAGQTAASAQMKPLPEKLPPRRTQGPV